jgi:hypothetical protein
VHFVEHFVSFSQGDTHHFFFAHNGGGLGFYMQERGSMPPATHGFFLHSGANLLSAVVIRWQPGGPASSFLEPDVHDEVGFGVVAR